VIGKIAVDKFFQSGLEVLKAGLKQKNDHELALLKADLARQGNLEIAAVRHDLEKELLAEKLKADNQRDRFHQQIQDEAAAEDRVRSQIVLWANPILSAVRSLELRLNNILNDSGYEGLDAVHPPKDMNWSVSYDYFLHSTMYLFAQYFCWVRMLELELSFEVFGSRVVKESFFAGLVKVSKALGDYHPPSYEGNDPDTQVFRLQQQAIGEILSLEKKQRCLGYASFLTKIADPHTAVHFLPLKNLFDNIKPGEKRWNRLTAVLDAISGFRKDCEGLLALERARKVAP
jgi:hypothetical protein